MRRDVPLVSTDARRAATLKDLRETYAKERDEKGRWPDPVIAPGVGDPEGSSSGPGKLKVEKDGWPRKALVMKQKYDDLANMDTARQPWGYKPDNLMVLLRVAARNPAIRASLPSDRHPSEARSAPSARCTGVSSVAFAHGEVDR